MTGKGPKTAKSTKLTPDLLEWLKENKDNEWENVSQGISRSVRIAKRVYETATDDELNKFVHPGRYKKKKN